MVIQLGRWGEHFDPDGVSLHTYLRIGRLIRQHGPLVKITLPNCTEESLCAALDKLEPKKG